MCPLFAIRLAPAKGSGQLQICCEGRAVDQPIRMPCSACGHDGAAQLSQAVCSKQLRWSRSIDCPNCGIVEEDDIGFPPEALREKILQAFGRWTLVVGEQDRLAAIKIIRNAFDLSMEEAAARKRAFPVLYIGTRVEAEWLKALMSASGIASEVARVSEGPG